MQKSLSHAAFSTIMYPQGAMKNSKMLLGRRYEIKTEQIIEADPNDSTGRTTRTRQLRYKQYLDDGRYPRRA